MASSVCLWAQQRLVTASKVRVSTTASRSGQPSHQRRAREERNPQKAGKGQQHAREKEVKAAQTGKKIARNKAREENEH